MKKPLTIDGSGYIVLDADGNEVAEFSGSYEERMKNARKYVDLMNETGKVLRRSKMYALVQYPMNSSVIIHEDAGMLNIFPKHKDAQECRTKNEKVLPVVVTIERSVK